MADNEIFGREAARPLACPVTLCHGYGAFFRAASGQVRMGRSNCAAARPSPARMTSTRRVRSVLTNSGPDSGPIIAVETGEQTRSVVAN